MGGDDGAVNQGVFEVWLVGEAFEDACKDAALHPATKTLEDAVPVAEIARQVAPGHARSHAPQHRLKKQAIVFGRRPRIGGLTGQQRRDLLPDRVAHHEPRPLKHRPTPPKHGLHTPGQPGKPSMSTGPSTIAQYLSTEGWGTTTLISSGKDVYIHYAARDFAHALKN